MQKIFSILAMILFLSGCVTKMNVEQGNILNETSVSKLHTGMSKEQVVDILGNPVLVNTFNDNRIDYVYTYQEGRQKMAEKYLTLIFKYNRLVKIEGNLYSTFMR